MRRPVFKTFAELYQSFMNPVYQGGVGFHSGQATGKRQTPAFSSCLHAVCPTPTLLITPYK